MILWFCDIHWLPSNNHGLAGCHCLSNNFYCVILWIEQAGLLSRACSKTVLSVPMSWGIPFWLLWLHFITSRNLGSLVLAKIYPEAAQLFLVFYLSVSTPFCKSGEKKNHQNSETWVAFVFQVGGLLWSGRHTWISGTLLSESCCQINYVIKRQKEWICKSKSERKGKHQQNEESWRLSCCSSEIVNSKSLLRTVKPLAVWHCAPWRDASPQGIQEVLLPFPLWRSNGSKSSAVLELCWLWYKVQ